MPISRATDAQFALLIGSGLATVADFEDAQAVQYEFLGETMGMVQEHTQNDGLRGSRARSACRIRVAKEAAGGGLTIEPTPLELTKLLQVALGDDTDTLSPHIITLTESLPMYGILVNKVTDTFLYPDCVCNKFTLSGSQSQPVRVQFDSVGTTETTPAGTWPAVDIPAIDCDTPYMMYDMTFSLSLAGSVTEARSFEIMLDNAVDQNRYLNSVTRSGLDALDRIVTLKMDIPWDSNSLALHDQAIAGGTATLTLTNGGSSTVFTFGNVKSEARTPTQTRRGDETYLSLNMRAYESTGGTPELAVTHTVV